MQDKIKLIDEICEKHPSYGVDKRWSKYVGGMKDTGQWFFRKMLDVPQEELQEFLNGIILKENEVEERRLAWKLMSQNVKATVITIEGETGKVIK